MPSPPRGTVPVNQGRGFASLFHLSTSGPLSVMDATIQAVSVQTSKETITDFKRKSGRFGLTNHDADEWFSNDKEFRVRDYTIENRIARFHPITSFSQTEVASI